MKNKKILMWTFKFLLHSAVSLLTLTQRHNHHHHSLSHMGGTGGVSSTPFTLTLTFSFIITLLLVNPSILTNAAQSNTTTIETQPPPPNPTTTVKTPPPPPVKPSSTFKPGIAVLVGALTTTFSLTFLFLLYIKHCNNNNNTNNYHPSRGSHVPPITARKNSGIDRCIVESLPIFRFGSLMGQKEGLDCAVCLNKFESSEVLRLLPKCKHAFHVECVDTWLDAHSTCPLCRHRVDPEDILLVQNPNESFHIEKGRNSVQTQLRELAAETRRVSGRHSSVGERDGGFLEIILETGYERMQNAASFRRSLDSAITSNTTATSKSKNDSVGVGCFVRPRKDGMLLTQETNREKDRTRLEHRIIVSPTPKPYSSGVHQRWSDVQPSDLLYLTAEMIISGGSQVNQHRPHQHVQVPLHWNKQHHMMNSRSVSEITGLSRFLSNDNRNREGEGRNQHHRGEDEQWEREREGVVSRWLGWISRSQTQPSVR